MTTTVAAVAVEETMAIAPQMWTSSLCDWHTDMPSTCETVWCGLCQMSNQYELLTNGVGKCNPFIVGGLLLLDATITSGLAAKVFALHLRTETRRRYNITPGDDLNECCNWLWCTPCSVCQTMREMSARGEFPGAVCVSSMRAPAGSIAMGAVAIPAQDPEEEEYEETDAIVYPTKQ
jgi:Cys-rich protein (TIGR01571 family)